jgi:hypothetical protein
MLQNGPLAVVCSFSLKSPSPYTDEPKKKKSIRDKMLFALIKLTIVWHSKKNIK